MLARSVDVEVLDEAGGLEAEWWDLWRGDPCATPFQTPAWLLPWRKHFNEGESAVLTLREEGRLVALFPLMRLDGRLLLWGAGTSDWLGGVSDPSLVPEMLSEALMRHGEPLDLFQLPEGSPLLHVPAPEGWEDQRGPSESCIVLSLPASLSANMRQNLRYYRHRSARAGSGEPEEVGAAGLPALVDLHMRRWREQNQPGIFADPRMFAWLEEAAARMEAAGLLRLYVLRMAGRIGAALCVLRGKGRAYYYIGGFDPGHAALGLGTVLVGHAIAEAEREGFSVFDFLRGREEYKYRWGAADQPSYARCLAPP
jgi:CelD/BcsL family acetyltransferase involved in cellulose biosynthesis